MKTGTSVILEEQELSDLVAKAVFEKLPLSGPHTAELIWQSSPGTTRVTITFTPVEEPKE